MFGDQACEKLAHYQPRTILDVGCGTKDFERNYSDRTAHIETCDTNPAYEPDHVCTVQRLAHSLDYAFNAIWCCHVLEHVHNTQAFLQDCHSLLADDGVFVITVPPPKPHLVGGHVTIWCVGTLLYQLVLAGFDCRHARWNCYDYNISMIVRVKHSLPPLPSLANDFGDIELLRPWFPPEAVHGEALPARARW